MRNKKSVFEYLIEELSGSVINLRLSILLTVSLLGSLGFFYGIYRYVFLNVNFLIALTFSLFLFLFLLSCIICTYFLVKPKRFNGKYFSTLSKIILILFSFLFISLPYMGANKGLSALIDSFVAFGSFIFVSFCLGSRWGFFLLIVLLLNTLFIFFNFLGFHFSFNNQWIFPVEKQVGNYLINSLAWAVTFSLFSFFSAGIIKKLKGKVLNSLDLISEVEEQNKKDLIESMRVNSELEAVSNLRTSIMSKLYAENSLSAFNLDVFFNGNEGSKDFTPFYESIQSNDDWLFCFGKVSGKDLHSISTILMIQTSLSNSFSSELQKEESLDTKNILSNMNQTLFFNNQYRIANGIVVNLVLAHYNQKSDQIKIINLGQEVSLSGVETAPSVDNQESAIIDSNIGIFHKLDLDNLETYQHQLSDINYILLNDVGLDITEEQKNLNKTMQSKEIVNHILKNESFEKSYLACIKKNHTKGN